MNLVGLLLLQTISRVGRKQAHKAGCPICLAGWREGPMPCLQQGTIANGRCQCSDIVRAHPEFLLSYFRPKQRAIGPFRKELDLHSVG